MVRNRLYKLKRQHQTGQDWMRRTGTYFPLGFGRPTQLGLTDTQPHTSVWTPHQGDGRCTRQSGGSSIYPGQHEAQQQKPSCTTQHRKLNISGTSPNLWAPLSCKKTSTGPASIHTLHTVTLCQRTEDHGANTGTHKHPCRSHVRCSNVHRKQLWMPMPLSHSQRALLIRLAARTARTDTATNKPPC